MDKWNCEIDYYVKFVTANQTLSSELGRTEDRGQWKQRNNGWKRLNYTDARNCWNEELVEN